MTEIYSLNGIYQIGVIKINQALQKVKVKSISNMIVLLNTLKGHINTEYNYRNQYEITFHSYTIR